ncbi:unnamed protein product [Prorocentrum cordatum]|uniref:PKD domain-containing protein n=1 Tax=Prorocentrum cordatum TaxID=2364126 RepID=A0ABN9VJI4_9DINO|nr:unnamed protein product [Polarella glacialis]
MQETLFVGELAHAPAELVAGPHYVWTFSDGAALDSPRSTTALTGWKRMALPQSRPPHPRVALRLLVETMIAAGQLMEAIVSVVAFVVHLRPSERLRLKGTLTTAPTRAMAGAPPILLHPRERGPGPPGPAPWTRARWPTTRCYRGS